MVWSGLTAWEYDELLRDEAKNIELIERAERVVLHEALRADLELSTYEYWKMWLTLSGLKPEDIISKQYGEECSSRSDDSP